MTSEYELLTYKEISERLNIKMTSARQTVSRRRWRRVKQNDGAVKVEVPVSYLQRPVVNIDEVIDVNVGVNVDVDISVLRAENLYLQKRIEDLEKDRDKWSALANKSWFQRLFK